MLGAHKNSFQKDHARQTVDRSSSGVILMIILCNLSESQCLSEFLPRANPESDSFSMTARSGESDWKACWLDSKQVVTHQENTPPGVGQTVPSLPVLKSKQNWFTKWCFVERANCARKAKSGRPAQFVLGHRCFMNNVKKGAQGQKGSGLTVLR